MQRIYRRFRARLESPTLWWRVGVGGLALLGGTGLLVAVADVYDDRERTATIRHLQADVDSLRSQLACRADAVDRVTALEASVNGELALGLAAFAEDDEAGLALHTANVRTYTSLLDVAREQAEAAATRCETDNPATP